MHIYAGLMVWRDMSARHGQCLADLQLLCRERGIGFTNGTIYGDALVSRAQSIAASMFLRHPEADVMWTCGSDTVFEAEDVISMCEKALAGFDIIGALVMKRAESPSVASPIPPVWMTLDSAASPVETSYISSGFAAYSKAVFAALVKEMPLCHQDHAEPWWPFCQTLVVPDEKAGFLYLSEDWALAHRAREHGFRCWIDPSVRVGHLSTATLTLEDMLRTAKPEPQVMRVRAVEGGLIEVETQTPVGV